MWAVDTNLLIRYYTADDPVQTATALAWLKTHAPCRVPITVVLEMYWVLESAYEMPADRIASVLQHLLDSPAFELESPRAVLRALEATAGGLEFPDALHWALAHDCEGLATFDDRGFARKARRMKLVPPVIIPALHASD